MGRAHAASTPWQRAHTSRERSIPRCPGFPPPAPRPPRRAGQPEDLANFLREDGENKETPPPQGGPRRLHLWVVAVGQNDSGLDPTFVVRYLEHPPPLSLLLFTLANTCEKAGADHFVRLQDCRRRTVARVRPLQQRRRRRRRQPLLRLSEMLHGVDRSAVAGDLAVGHGGSGDPEALAAQVVHLDVTTGVANGVHLGGRVVVRHFGRPPPPPT